MILVRCRQTFFVCSAFFLLLSAAVSVKGQATGLKLDYPNGNEIFYTTRDTSIVIRWSGVDDTTKVNLDISSDAGLSWNLLKDSLTGSSYEWNIRGAAISSTYRIRVAQVRPPAPRDDIQYTGHVGPVYDAVWSPSGRRVASISAQVHVWDAGTGGTLEATILPGPRTVYNGLNWSADSLRIVAGGEDQVARVYDATTNALVQGLNIPGVINECFFNPQSTEILVASDDSRARVFVMPSALSLAPYIATGQIEHVAWSPNGLRVLVCASQARVQNRAGGAPLQFTRHGVSVDDGAWSPDGKFICSVGGDASIRMWDAQTAVERWSILNVPDGVRCVTFSADGSMVAVGGGDSSLVVYNAVDGSVLHAINSHALAVRMVAFSKDGRYLASASDDDFTRVFDLKNNRTARDLKHGNNVSAVRWGPDDGRILTASTDGTARIWQIREIILQGDTSDASFSIAPPPPAFARFVTNGDTLQIGDQTTITLRLEGAQFIDLADIDSVRFTLSYDGSMLHRLASTVPVLFEDDSANYKILTMQTVPLPLADTVLMNLQFRATLGADTVTSLFLSRIALIGSGPGLTTEKSTDTILVRGLCRTDGQVRLFNPLGESLGLIVQRTAQGTTTMSVVLAEAGATTVKVYDLFGRELWSDVASHSELSDRYMERSLDAALTGRGPIMVIITTPTQRLGKLTLE
ncbi:MAG: WD40 repeat domain-containing protein [bacterium]|nr:WD40 repeat domain-containing protein [bacterium]